MQTGADALTGRVVVHYQILEKLGEGGMGVVYKARDTHLDRFVAIKVLPSGKLRDPDSKRRFVQEARAASALIIPASSPSMTSLRKATRTSSSWSTCRASRSIG